MTNRISIIDCGTNTFHLLIVGIKEGNSTILHSEKVAVKIGQGGINDQLILPEAIERATVTLGSFRRTITDHKANHVHAFATSAFRNARNGIQVKDHIKNITGIDIQIISGDVEAKFIFNGVNAAMDIGDHPALVIDIGGGSVEFIIGTRNTIIWQQSFEIGAQRLLDLFHHHDPITSMEIKELEKYLKNKLGPLLARLKEHNPSILIGSSGTFDTLSDIYCLKKRISHQEGDSEIPLELEEYGEIHQELLTKNKKERLEIPGMIEMRVEMIVVASSLIHWLLKVHQFTGIRVSRFSLKEGVLDQIKKGLSPYK